MLLINLLYERAYQLREFILLPWELKKQRIYEFWRKYGHLYMILFGLCIIIAFINVYMDWSSHTNSKPNYTKFNIQSGGINTETIATNKPVAVDNNPVDADNKPVAVDNKPVAAKNEKNTSPSTNTPSGMNTTEKNKDETSNSKAANHKEINKTIINQIIKNTSTTNTSTTNTLNGQKTDNNINYGNTKKNEIKERRLAKQSTLQRTSLSDTLGSVGNNLSSVMTGGVGKALSVLGTFFLAIIGLILFCAAPVVIFYLWMKKLILPLFPTR